MCRKGKMPRKIKMLRKRIKTLMPSPDARAEVGWAQYEVRVVIVDINGEDVHIRTGFICSTSSSHTVADNMRRTIVWGDEPFNSDADNADDAHERAFDVSDYHLLKVEEAETLRNPVAAIKWFKGIYTSYHSRRIASALSSTKLVPDQTALAKLLT